VNLLVTVQREDCGFRIQFAAKDRLIRARNYSAESTTQFRRHHRERTCFAF
jgi:hypothetical protein